MEILNQIKELELRAGKYEAGKYDSLKECFEEEIPKINKLITEVESKLSDIKIVLKNINPILSLENGSKGKRTSVKPIIERIYKEMMENDEQFYVEDLISKFGVTENNKGWIVIKLKEMPGVQIRQDGRKIVLYYFKGSSDKTKVELGDGTSISKKFSKMG